MWMSIFLSLLGVFLIVLGAHRLKKPFSAWFLATTPYTVAGAYASIPFGLAMILWAFISFVSPIWARFLFFTGAITAFLGTFLIYLFFKPAWLKWLEHEHKHLLPLLENEASKMGFNALDDRIQTRDDLERWVEEMRRKYGR